MEAECTSTPCLPRTNPTRHDFHFTSTRLRFQLLVGRILTTVFVGSCNDRRFLLQIRLLFGLCGTQSSSGSPPLPSAIAFGPGHPLHPAKFPRGHYSNLNHQISPWNRPVLARSDRQDRAVSTEYHKPCKVETSHVHLSSASHRGRPQKNPLRISELLSHYDWRVGSERKKFIVSQPPIGEKYDYDSENSWISEGFPSSNRRRKRSDGRGQWREK